MIIRRMFGEIRKHFISKVFAMLIDEMFVKFSMVENCLHSHWKKKEIWISNYNTTDNPNQKLNEAKQFLINCFKI